jgi:acyl-coenzyme A thioesterase PaaI-like protein
MESHGRKQLLNRLEQLETSYLAAPYNEYHDPGIRVSEGEADIVIPIQDKLKNTSGSFPASVCIKAMNDSAVFAVSSLTLDSIAQTVNFNATLTRAAPTGELLARGRFVGMSGTHYLAETILTDSTGTEIGRGDGVFVVDGGEKP